MKQYLIVLISVVFSSCYTSKNSTHQEADFGGEIVKITEKKYDAKDKAGEYTVIYRDNLHSRVFYYNDQKSLTKQEFINPEGEVYWVIENTYDEDNVKTGTEISYGGRLESRQINKVIDGKAVEGTRYDGEGNIKEVYSYKYTGEWKSEITTKNPKGELISVRSIHREEGEIVSVVEKDATGQITYNNVLENNEQGDVVKSETERPIKEYHEIVYYAYDYDAQGNWVRKYHFDNQREITFITVRNLVYKGDEKKVLTKEALMGEWFVFGRHVDRMEFKADQSFIIRDKDKEGIVGRWELDTEEHQILLKPETKEVKIAFDYTMEGQMIRLFAEEINEEMTLEKRVSTKKTPQQVTESAFLKKWAVKGKAGDFIEFKEEQVFVNERPDKAPRIGEWKLDVKNKVIHIKEEGKSNSAELIYYFRENTLLLYSMDGELQLTLDPVDTGLVK
ncbi:hypothetical protein [Flammeovirga sp. SubArs3]|uniref:hypothetical protein n=1 Tax=Flammeovirga sp. SubArs3 TaxID=2995316 RepID=UPI00248B7F85|nr:hypothetical protein [Flammeovirga sp. SubArs3]